jgi:uncharacterized membrane protein YhiD involved in acid resistance
MKQPTQLLQEMQQLDIFRPSIFEFAANIFIALICGTLISLVYRFIRRKVSPSPALANSLILLSLITAIVTLVIGNNLARAFGLVGTMSIIRFRTAVRDVEDIVFIFFSLTMGMAAGVGLNSVALIGTVVICTTILLLHLVSEDDSATQRRGFLQIIYNSATEQKSGLRQILRKYARRSRLLSERKLSEQKQVDAFYRLTLRKGLQHTELLHELRTLESVTDVNWFFEEENGETPGS